MLKELVFIIRLLTCIYDMDNDQRKSNVFTREQPFSIPYMGSQK